MIRKSSIDVRSDAERGRLVARLLAGAWREDSVAPTLSDSELDEIAPLLCQTGSAALGWWKVRDQKSEFDRAAVTDNSRGLSAQRDTPGIDHQNIADPERVKHQRSTVSASLHDAYRQFRLAARVHEQEIKYVVSLLRAAGIEPVLVKGWAIARLYPDPGLRPYGDIDLCVRPDQFAKAEQTLKGLENIDGHYVDLHEGFAKVELGAHSSLSAGRRHPCLHWDELFERSQLVSLGPSSLSVNSPARKDHRGAGDPEEIKVRVLSDEDHLRILCLHLLRSGAWRPLWLCDVAVALESRRPDFDWDICLTRDPKIAEWVTGTVALAQELLGAESTEHKAGSRGQGAESRGQGAKSLHPTPYALGPTRYALRPTPYALCPSPYALRPTPLPRWLAPAILRQWGRSLNPHAVEMALPALSARKRDGRMFFREIYARWDQPVRATIALRGRFNNWPRWPYQLGELLLRSSEVPKQLRQMIVRAAEEFSSRWQRHRIQIDRESARPVAWSNSNRGF